MKKALLLSVGFVAITTQVKAQLPFATIDTNYRTTTIVVPPSPLSYKVLFNGNVDTVYQGAQYAMAKNNHDFTGILPYGNGKDSMWVIVNHEITNTKNDILGDGGGMTSFKIVKKNGQWNVARDNSGRKFFNVDFSALSGTNINCGGATTPFGKFMTAEEYPIESNTQLYNNGNGFQDTSDYIIPAGNGIYSGKTIKKYQQLGWMVQVDAVTGIAEKKIYGMGRFSHEGAMCLADGKTVYLTDDFTPGILFKFIATTANDYTAGQLYAYKQGANGVGGSWLTMPMDLDSLFDMRTIALQHGATGFTRLEWVVEANNKLYIAETGLDNANYKSTWKLTTPAAHHANLDTLYGMAKDSVLNDYYGRVLELDPATNTVRPYLEGGFGTDGKTNFSNPDGLAVAKQNGKTYLVINEDLNGRTFGRSASNLTICEVFYLDLSKTNPTVDDLKRFVIGPAGSETTGGVFNEDGSVYLVNIQHPSSSNPFPFNNSATVAITGFNLNPVNIKNVNLQDNVSAYPNPASRTLQFSKPISGTVYDANGRQVSTLVNTTVLDVQPLARGLYFIQRDNKEIIKVVVE